MKFKDLFRCVDCRTDTAKSGEYYSVSNAVWAASGLWPNDGMLCLACLERRIGRPLTGKDFTCMWPEARAWKRHVAARDVGWRPPVQIEMWPVSRRSTLRVVANGPTPRG